MQRICKLIIIIRNQRNNEEIYYMNNDTELLEHSITITNCFFVLVWNNVVMDTKGLIQT